MNLNLRDIKVKSLLPLLLVSTWLSSCSNSTDYNAITLAEFDYEVENLLKYKGRLSSYPESQLINLRNSIQSCPNLYEKLTWKEIKDSLSIPEVESISSISTHNSIYEDMPQCQELAKKKSPVNFFADGFNGLNIDAPQTIGKAKIAIKQELENLGFKEIPLNGSSFGIPFFSHTNLLFINPDEKTFSQRAILISFSETSKLQNVKCYANESYKLGWKYPKKYCDSHDLVDLNELSWKYIDCLLHNQPKNTKKEFLEEDPCERLLYNSIEKHGLSQTIIRTRIILSKKSFKLILCYNYENELESGSVHLSKRFRDTILNFKMD